MEKVSIFIPYKKTADDLELKFALRSIEQNCKFNYQILLVGDIPKWVNRDAIICLEPEIKRVEPYPKAWNVIEKLKHVLKNIDTSEMLLSYDDIVFLSPIEYEDIAKIVALKKLPTSENFKTDASKAWKEIMIFTMQALKRNNLPMLNYETHLPRLFDVQKLKEIIALFGFEKRPYLFSTLYFNWIKPKKKDITVLADNPDQKIKASVYFAGDWENVCDSLENYLFLNWSEQNRTPELCKKLQELFPTPSIFEERETASKPEETQNPPTTDTTNDTLSVSV
jgi:hypothetical protein